MLLRLHSFLSVVAIVVVASKPCLELSEVAWLDELIGDARKGGIRILANESSTLENITNWDLQSTIFLALQVMGSVGESRKFTAR